MIDLARAAEAALLTGDFDSTIRFCDQGINLAPKEPVFWGNKTAALIRRAVTTRNRGIFSADAGVKKALIEGASADLRTALETSAKTLQLTAASPVTSDPASLALYQFQQLMALKLRSEALYVFTIAVDESYAVPAGIALEEYVAAEPDAKQRLGAQLRTGDMLLRANKFPEAFLAYQKILLNDAANLEAKVGAGVSLMNLGFATNDAASLGQGLDYLSRFVADAPAGHPLRGSTEEAVRFLKTPDSPEDDPPVAGVVVGGTASSETSAGGKSSNGSGVLNGTAIKLSQPPYPKIARFAHVRGSVQVQVLIDEDGAVLRARAESGHPLLKAVAVAAARQSKFSPTRLSGRPVKVSGIIIYNFQ